MWRKYKLENLLISVNNAIEYVDNGTLVNLTMDDEWYVYQGVNYKNVSNLKIYLSENDNIVILAKDWLSNIYTPNTYNQLQQYGNNTYIKVMKYSNKDIITIYRDTGSEIEALSISYFKPKNSVYNYRTEIDYLKCGEILTHFEYLYDEGNDKSEYTNKIELDYDYETLKANMNENFSLSDRTIYNYQQTHRSFIDTSKHSGFIYQNGYGLVFRQEKDNYYNYSFYVEYNQKGIKEETRTDEYILNSFTSSIISAFEDIVIDYLSL